MCTGEVYTPALPHQGGERGSHVQSISFHSSYLDVRESWGLPELSSRSHLHPIQFNEAHYWSTWFFPLTKTGISKTDSDVAIHDLETQNQPEESLLSVQHLNFKLSAPLDKTDNYARPVTHYPQTFALCTAEVSPDKASVSPSSFKGLISLKCVCLYNTYIIHIYCTHTYM